MLKRNILHIEHIKIVIITRQFFNVKLNYEILKIENNVIEILRMVKKIVSSVISKISCFSKVLVLSFL